jgi:integrase/recombinase XerD
VGHTIRAFVRLAGLSEETPLVDVRPDLAERAMAKLRSRYGPGTAWRYATSWVQLFRAFTAAGLLLESPFARVDWPKRPRLLPLSALTRDEMDRLLGAPNLRLPSGVRNRAILELFYSTGIRLAECAGLAVRDVDFARGTLLVRRGKGGKARVVPLGEQAMSWLRRYLKEARSRWAGKAEALFIGQEGRPVSPLWIERVVSCLGRKAGIKKPVTPHALRRTCATHLLSAGASAWAVKGILGHADFKSLGRYVVLGAKELKDEHGRTHPRS